MNGALTIQEPQTIEVEMPWSKVDVAMDSIFWTAFMVDWMQTRYIAKNGYVYQTLPEEQVKCGASVYTLPARHEVYENCTEKNSFLGRHPSLRKVDVYFALSGLSYALISRKLPASWRRAYMVSCITLEAYCVGNNIRVGIRVH